MFNLAEVKETTGNLFITPGVHEVVIDSFEFGKNARTDREIITIKHRTTDGSAQLSSELPASTEVAEGKKQAPIDMTIIKLRHIARAIIGEEGLVNLTASSVDELVQKLNEFLANKPYRQKFSGEEVISNGKSWDKAIIPLPSPKSPMAEPITEGATTLTYDKSNPYDYRRKEVAPVVLPGIGGMMPPAGMVPPHIQ